MAATASVMMNDFIGLPIIIISPSSTETSEIAAEQERSQQRQLSTSSTYTAASSSSSTLKPKWNTDFSDFADGVWARMTQSMKKKLRDAAVEVLKQTDDNGEEGVEKMTWMYDDDAKFLD